MHKVVESGDGYRQTQIVFTIANDCFAGWEGPEPLRVIVAGLNGRYVAPYDGPHVTFTSRREDGQTTGAFALAVDDRTLCVYLTWDPDTTPDELEAARQVVESLRAQPRGTDFQGGLRITFTLPAGWDTG